MRLARMTPIAGVLLAAACADGPSTASPDVELRSAPAPLMSATSGAVSIPDRYVVVLRPTTIGPSGAAGAAASMVPRGEGAVLATYDDALKGFTAQLTPAGLAAVRARGEVSFVEPDQVYQMDATQTGAPWGLDRIDQVSLPLSGSFTYNGNGAGVNVYIVDTGIRTTHSQFGGRAVAGFTAINDGRGSTDCNGHGTHVAGTVGGSTYGVAKGAKLYAVRVLGCNGSGTTSGVIAGINWVTANRIKPAVANMSLGGGFSSALNTAVANAINAGVTFAVAAGNDNQNACNYSPASAPAALTVGATGINDARATFSNFGSCLDIFAPGVGILSATSTSDVSTASFSGTSMASPHVAGAAALYLQANPAATPAQVGTALTSNASTNKVTSPGTGSVNRLLFSAFIGGVVTPPPPPPPLPAAPVAAYTYTCNALRQCIFDGRSSTGTGLTYRWTNTRDLPASGATVMYQWDRGGVAKVVTLTVYDQYGRSNSIAKTITVY